MVGVPEDALTALADVAEVIWDSKYAPVAAVRATATEAAILRNLPYVLSISEPVQGSWADGIQAVRGSPTNPQG